MRELREQLYIRWDEALMVLVMQAGFFLFGEIILAIVVCVLGEQSCIQLGTLMSLMVPLFIMMFVGIGALPVYFGIAVCMGAVRKRFVPVYFIVTFLENVMAAGVSYLLFNLESLLLQVIYPGIEIESDMQVIFQLRYLLAACLGIVALNAFFGTLFVKFGKLALNVFWVLWMVVFIGGPRLGHFLESAGGTALGKVFGTFLGLVPVITESIILTGIVIISAVLLVVSWVILCRQPAEI